ncbi:MAG: hypothetical protein E7539_03475 [Ruminococcaceae bacterium]|nr:hypothetical protein [Oscillospiraceae bacterium]
MKNLIDFLNKLEENKTFYKLSKVRDSILVEIAVPGERWEVEFFDDGHIEVEKFISQGEIFDQTELDILFSNFSD